MKFVMLNFTRPEYSSMFVLSTFLASDVVAAAAALKKVCHKYFGGGDVRELNESNRPPSPPRLFFL